MYRVKINNKPRGDESPNANFSEFLSNDRHLLYELWAHSTMNYFSGNVPDFDIVASLIKWENGSQEIVSYKIIVDSHMGNLEVACLEPCVDDQNI